MIFPVYYSLALSLWEGFHDVFKGRVRCPTHPYYIKMCMKPLKVICIFSEWLKIWRENTTTKMIFKAQKRISSSSSRNEGLLTDSGLESGLGSSSRGSNDYLLQPVATGLIDGLTSRLHIVLSITYTVQQFISLFVMLVFMTFNLYLCFTIVLSHGLGNV